MTIQVFKIPLENTPQKFDITLSGFQLTAITQWNEYMPSWVITLIDRKTSLPLVVGIPLVPGIDIIHQFKFIGIDGSLTVYTDGDEFAEPTYDNLGSEANLYYITESENV